MKKINTLLLISIFLVISGCGLKTNLTELFQNNSTGTPSSINETEWESHEIIPGLSIALPPKYSIEEGGGFGMLVKYNVVSNSGETMFDITSFPLVTCSDKTDVECSNGTYVPALPEEVYEEQLEQSYGEDGPFTFVKEISTVDFMGKVFSFEDDGETRRVILFYNEGGVYSIMENQVAADEDFFEKIFRELRWRV